MTSKPNLIEIDNQPLLVKIPEKAGNYPLVLMIHGLTGDETVMFVFATRLPSQVAIVSPRGYYQSTAGGYSWCQDCNAMRIGLQDLKPSVDRLRDLAASIKSKLTDYSSLHLMGFSQGASLALSWLYLYPDEISSLASLAGRLPENVNFHPDDPRLSGKPVFWGHGSRDQLVPVSFAREGVSQLEKAGTDIQYCEDAVGHKLSASCYRSMEAFYRKRVFPE